MYLVFTSRITVFLFVVVRFYTFGIGPEACPNLVQGVAGAGKGQAHFIAEDERMPVKVNRIFRGRHGDGHVTGKRNISLGYVVRICPRACQVQVRVKRTLWLMVRECQLM